MPSTAMEKERAVHIKIISREGKKGKEKKKKCALFRFYRGILLRRGADGNVAAAASGGSMNEVYCEDASQCARRGCSTFFRQQRVRDKRLSA